MTHTFAGFEKVNGKDALLITSEPDTPSVKVKKPFKLWIEQSTGWPLKGEAAFEISSGSEFTTSVEVTLVRTK